MPEQKKAIVSLEQVMSACQDDAYIGFCLNCGAETSGIEPDARKYECDNCGHYAVYGAEELLIMLVP